MESDIGKILKFLSEIFSRKQVVEALLASTLTLQIYDWLLVLPQEVEYVWRASWSWSKLLYLVTRYTPFATISLELRNVLTTTPTPESCNWIAHTAVWLSFVGLAFAEIVLIVRTYAVWKRDKRVGIGLASLFVLCQTAGGVIVEKWVGAASVKENPHPEIFRGCIFEGGTRLIYVGWVILTVEEGVSLILMIISAVTTYREYKSNLMDVVYRDGIRFYLYIFCVTLANVLITLLLPMDFVTVGSSIEIVLHSILACRLMIGIREATHSLGHKSETFELSAAPRALEFARRSVGENTGTAHQLSLQSTSFSSHDFPPPNLSA